MTVPSSSTPHVNSELALAGEFPGGREKRGEMMTAKCSLICLEGNCTNRSSISINRLFAPPQSAGLMLGLCMTC